MQKEHEAGGLGGRRGRRWKHRNGTAEEALLADEAARQVERLLVVGLDPLVDERALEHVRDKVIPDALDLVRARGRVEARRLGQNRAMRVHSDHLDGDKDAGQGAGQGAD